MEGFTRSDEEALLNCGVLWELKEYVDMDDVIQLNNIVFFFFGIQESDLENDEKVIETCVKKAYGDMCRTLDFCYSISDMKNMSKGQEELFKKAKEEFVNGLKAKLEGEFLSARSSSIKDFDSWHENLCSKLIGFDNKNVLKRKLTVGQAQKWINMTIKYLRVLGKWNVEIENVHIPIDEFILSAAAIEKGTELYEGAGVKGLGVPRFVESWSGIEIYTTYLDYQKKLREACEESLLDWEAKAWISEAIKRA